MTQSLFHRVGATEFDGTANGFSETLEPLDPGRDILLGLFEQAITSELGSRWDAVKTGTQLASADVVQMTLPFRPDQGVMRQLRTEFPLLAVYRTGTATIEEHTLAIDKLTQPWQAVYVLGPLPIEDVRKLGDVLQAVAKVVRLTVERRGHPDFDGGALQFYPDKGAFGSCRVTGYEVGQAQFASGDDAPTYWMAQVNLETIEFVHPLDGFATDFEGASYGIGVEGDGGVLPDLINVDTDAIP